MSLWRLFLADICFRFSACPWKLDPAVCSCTFIIEIWHKQDKRVTTDTGVCETLTVISREQNGCTQAGVCGSVTFYRHNSKKWLLDVILTFTYFQILLVYLGLAVLSSTSMTDRSVSQLSSSGRKYYIYKLLVPWEMAQGMVWLHVHQI